jgi:hypothetical protein
VNAASCGRALWFAFHCVYDLRGPMFVACFSGDVEGIAHLGKADDAVRFGDALGDPGKEAQLHQEADLALVVL